MTDVSEEVDRLYGLPLESFVAERDALARRLRNDGDRAEADAVKRLAKPTLAAWAVNQAVRSQPAVRRELLAAGEDLRARQEELLAGRGKQDGLRAAAQREQAAVGELARAAAGLLSGKGRELTPGTLDRVRETLHAAAADDEVRRAVEAGRVEREARATGLGLGAAPPAPDRPKKRTRSRGDELRSAQAAQRKAEHAAETARRRARDAATALRDAEREAERAERAREKAASRARKAGQEAERRDRQLDEAKARVKELEAEG